MKLKLVYTNVWTCTRCGTWYYRSPKWADSDKGDCCDKCGVTSFNVREGRPYGPRSKDWGKIKAEFEEMVKYNEFDENYPVEQFVLVE